jgi:hypothetical protein
LPQGRSRCRCRQGSNISDYFNAPVVEHLDDIVCSLWYSSREFEVWIAPFYFKGDLAIRLNIVPIPPATVAVPPLPEKAA